MEQPAPGAGIQRRRLRDTEIFSSITIIHLFASLRAAAGAMVPGAVPAPSTSAIPRGMSSRALAAGACATLCKSVRWGESPAYSF